MIRTLLCLASFREYNDLVVWLHVLVVCFFSLLRTILLYRQSPFCLFIHFVYSFIVGLYLDCLQVWLIMNKTACGTDIYVGIFSFLLDK